MQPSCRQGVCLSPSVELGLTDIEMGDEDEPIYDEPWDVAHSTFLSAFEIEYEVSLPALIISQTTYTNVTVYCCFHDVHKLRFDFSF